MRIYTKTGDAGQTALPGGKRVAKSDPRIAALGEVDELNASLGKARSEAGDREDLRPVLASLQRDLLALGSVLAGARPAGSTQDGRSLGWGADRATRLERLIDEREATLPALRAFILPGGGPLAATLHVARAICRRAERAVVALGPEADLEPAVLAYLNRLSDLLFVLAREANARAGVADEPW